MRNWLAWKNACRRLNLKNRAQFMGVMVLLLLLIDLMLFSCSREARELSLEMEISELVCDDGLHVFEGRILELNGIKSVTANIETHKAIISYHENQLSAEKIKSHLLDFGFTVDGQAGKPVARKRLPACCFE